MNVYNKNDIIKINIIGDIEKEELKEMIFKNIKDTYKLNNGFIYIPMKKNDNRNVFDLFLKPKRSGIKNHNVYTYRNNKKQLTILYRKMFNYWNMIKYICYHNKLSLNLTLCVLNKYSYEISNYKTQKDKKFWENWNLIQKEIQQIKDNKLMCIDVESIINFDNYFQIYPYKLLKYLDVNNLNKIKEMFIKEIEEEEKELKEIENN